MAGYGVLSQIPGLAGYVAGDEERRAQIAQAQAQQSGQIAQAGALQGILSRQRDLQREEQIRGALSGLSADASPDDVVKAIRPYAKADDLFKISQGSADRRFATQQAAESRRDALEARLYDIDKRSEDKALSREQAASLAKAAEATKRELAQMGFALRRDLSADRAADRNKPPAGYRFKQDGGLEAIPGGPADTKQQGALNTDTQMLDNSQAELDRLQREAVRLKDHPGLAKSTGLMSVAPLVGGIATIPGTDVANFKAGLDTLKSQAGFSVLQNMRNNSKTGGALGQVSDFENRMLQANLASLSSAQSEDEFKDALDKIINYVDDAKGRLRNAYNLKHGNKGGQSSPDAIPDSPPPGAVRRRQ